jgi:hypothetical protein
MHRPQSRAARKAEPGVEGGDNSALVCTRRHGPKGVKRKRRAIG